MLFNPLTVRSHFAAKSFFREDLMPELTADTQIQKIVDHLRTSVLEPAEKQKNAIVAEAVQKAEETLKTAAAGAAEILKKAEQEAVRIKSSAESACRIAARETITSLKLSIEKEVLKGTLSSRLAAAVDDIEIVKSAVRDTIAAYSKNGFRGSVEVTVGEKHRASLKEYLNTALAKDIAAAVTINAGPFKGCRIVFKDSKFALDLRLESLEEIFCSFLRPELRRSLFG